MSPRPLSIEEAVEAAALELAQRHDLDEIEACLHIAGISAEFAAKLVLLVPSAFAAAHFEPQGIAFPTHFTVGPVGCERRLPYALEPGFSEAKRLAQNWHAEKRESIVMRVLDWSAEASGIKEAKNKGLTPTRMSSIHHGDQW